MTREARRRSGMLTPPGMVMIGGGVKAGRALAYPGRRAENAELGYTKNDRTNEKVRRLSRVSDLLENNPGSDLLSHAPTRAVPSAVTGLTSVFGMGTGVTLLL